MFEDVKEYLNWYDSRSDIAWKLRATQMRLAFGIVLQRTHLVTGDDLPTMFQLCRSWSTKAPEFIPVFAGRFRLF